MDDNESWSLIDRSRERAADEQEQGREVFEQALTDPDSRADVPAPAEGDDEDDVDALYPRLAARSGG